MHESHVRGALVLATVVAILVGFVMWITSVRKLERFVGPRYESVDVGATRLRVAVENIRRENQDARGANASDTPDPWSELFEQRAGGELFLRADGRQFHSESDVIINRSSPYSPYFLEYDRWASRMRALALPAPPTFSEGTRGVFCGSYVSRDGTRAMTVCPEVHLIQSRAHVRMFWRLLGAVVLMRTIDEHERLSSQKVAVSEEAASAGARHEAAVRKILDEASKEMSEIAKRMDAVISQIQSDHTLKMRKIRESIRDLEAAAAENASAIQITSAEIRSFRDRLQSGERDLSDTSEKLKQLELRLQSERRAFDEARARLDQKSLELETAERTWSERMDTAQNLREKALLDKDAAEQRRGDIQRKIEDARVRRRAAEEAIAAARGGFYEDRARRDALESSLRESREEQRRLEDELVRTDAEAKAHVAKMETDLASLAHSSASLHTTALHASDAAAEASTATNDRAERDAMLGQLRFDISVLEGRPVNSVTQADVDAKIRSVHAKREILLARQSAAMNPKPKESEPAMNPVQDPVQDPVQETVSKPEEGPSNGVLRQGAVMRPDVHGRDSMSKDGVRLDMQEDGNLVLYEPGGAPIWQTNTRGQGLNVVMRDDGNLVMRDSAGAQVWASNSSNRGTPPYRAEVRSDGNFVVYDSSNNGIWETGTKNPDPVGEWIHTGSKTFNNICVDGNSAAGVTANGEMFWSDVGSRDNWHSIPGNLVQIAISGSRICGIDSTMYIWYAENFKAPVWQKLHQGQLSQIDLSGDIIAGCQTNGDVYITSWGTTDWKRLHALSGYGGGAHKLTHISIDGHRAVGVNSNLTPMAIFYTDNIMGEESHNRFNVGRGKRSMIWTHMDGEVKKISLSGNRIMAVDKHTNIHSATFGGPIGNWQPVFGQANEISVSSSYAYCRALTGDVYYMKLQ